MGKGALSRKNRDMKYFSDRWFGDAIYASLEQKEKYLKSVETASFLKDGCAIGSWENADYGFFWTSYRNIFGGFDDTDIDYLISQGKKAVRDLAWKFRNLGKRSNFLEEQCDLLLKE